MKTNIIIITLFITTCVLVDIDSSVGTQPVVASSQATSLTESISQLRNAWRGISLATKASSSAATISEAKAILDKFNEGSSPYASPVAAYLANRLAFIENSSQIAADENILFGDVTMRVETTLLFVHHFCNSPKDRASYECYLGELMPVGRWKSNVPTEIYALVKPPRTKVPIIDLGKMRVIASTFESIGLYEYAWRAYMELVYLEFSPAWPDGNTLENSSLSAQAAPSWQKIAECAYLAGDTQLAHSFLIKAAVFGNDELSTEAIGIAQKWKDVRTSTSVPSFQSIDPIIKQKSLLKIINLYVEMNAHPRAFVLIDQFKDILQNSNTLREEILTKWKEIIKDVSRESRMVTLYGYQVYPKGDPGKVRAPLAFSDEAMAAAQEQLKKVRDYQASQEKTKARSQPTSMILNN